MTPISTLECFLLLLILRLCTSTYLVLRAESSLVELMGDGTASRLMLILSSTTSSLFWKDQMMTWASSSSEEMLPVAMRNCETERQVIMFWCSSLFITSPDSHQMMSYPLSLASTKLSARKSMQVLMMVSSFM